MAADPGQQPHLSQPAHQAALQLGAAPGATQVLAPARPLHAVQLAQLLEQGVGAQVQLGVYDLQQCRAGAGQGSIGPAGRPAGTPVGGASRVHGLMPHNACQRGTPGCLARCGTRALASRATAKRRCRT